MQLRAVRTSGIGHLWWFPRQTDNTNFCDILEPWASIDKPV